MDCAAQIRVGRFALSARLQRSALLKQVVSCSRLLAKQQRLYGLCPIEKYSMYRIEHSPEMLVQTRESPTRMASRSRSSPNNTLHRERRRRTHVPEHDPLLGPESDAPTDEPHPPYARRESDAARAKIKQLLSLADSVLRDKYADALYKEMDRTVCFQQSRKS